VALTAGDTARAREGLVAVIASDPTYENAPTLLTETYYQDGLAAIQAGKWADAWKVLSLVGRRSQGYKQTRDLMRNALVRGKLWASVEMSVSAPEMRARKPNTHLQLDRVTLFSDGHIAMEFRVVVDIGKSADIMRPEAVYVRLGDTIVPAASWDGVFGSQRMIPILQLRVPSVGGWDSGTIEFKDVVPRLTPSGCFEFHYGVYYTMPTVCVP
jgi:hypothetical protein